MSNFVTYRAVTRIHLPPPVEGHLEADEVVSFDGAVLKKSDGTVLKIPYPTAIDAAIKAGWLVPEESEVTEYVPKPAGVEVRQAQSTGEKREVVNVMTVENEDVDLGSRKSVRANADHTKVSSGAPSGAVVQRDGDDGVVVGRFKSSAQSEPVVVGKDDQRVKKQIEASGKPQVERIGTVVRSATGDVAEARSGDDLEDLLPDAASSERPEPGIFKDDGVEVGSGGSSSTGGAEDGVVVGKVAKAAPISPQLDRNKEVLVKALRKWVEEDVTWNGKPVNLNELKMMAGAALAFLDEATAKATTKAPSPADPPATVPDPLANFDVGNGVGPWSLKTHWKTRMKVALAEHGDSISDLTYIIAQENSKSVITRLQKRIAELSA